MNFVFEDVYAPITPEQYADAFRAGLLWARALSPGDYFSGAGDESERRCTNRRLQFAFVDGACYYFYDELAPVFEWDKKTRRVIRNEERE